VPTIRYRANGHVVIPRPFGKRIHKSPALLPTNYLHDRNGDLKYDPFGSVQKSGSMGTTNDLYFRGFGESHMPLRLRE